MKRGYSLLELMAVVALIALFTGIGVINMHGVSEESRLRAAVDQMGAAFRLAAAAATQSGKPHALLITPDACEIRRPVLSEGAWSWARGARFALPQKVRVEGIGSNETAEREGEPAQWSVPIAPDDWGRAFSVRLRMASGARLTAEIGAIGRSILPLKEPN